MAALAGSCVKLCGSILEQLREAKHNKKECKSLQDVVSCIKLFLQSLSSSGMSKEGNEVLGR
jgi:hypothetical protein